METNSWAVLLVHWLVSGAAIYLTAKLVPGVRVRGYQGALVASLLIGAANYFIRPVLVLLTFPLTLITFGLFLWVVDAIILRLCAVFSSSLEIRGWFSALAASVVLAITGGFLHWFFV